MGRRFLIGEVPLYPPRFDSALWHFTSRETAQMREREIERKRARQRQTESEREREREEGGKETALTQAVLSGPSNDPRERERERVR